MGCSPVQREQLTVAVEGVAAKVDELQLLEPRQGGQSPKVVLLQVQAPQSRAQAQEGPWRNL